MRLKNSFKSHIIAKILPKTDVNEKNEIESMYVPIIIQFNGSGIKFWFDILLSPVAFL